MNGPPPTSYERFTRPKPEQVQLLTEVWWGSPGGVQYRLQSEFHWDLLPEGSEHVVHTDSDDRIVGTYVNAPLEMGDLIVLLAVDPQRQRAGYGQSVLAEAAQHNPDRPKIGTIELDNRRSYEAAVASGFVKIGQFRTRTFTRRSPRKHSQVVVASDRDLIASGLASHSHRGFRPEQVDLTHTLVWSDGSAGMQFLGHNWRVRSLGMPGPIDRVALMAMPWLGIDPNSFKFATGHYWWGHPERWPTLMEHAMAEYGFQAIVVTGDPEGGLWPALETVTSWGVGGTIIGDDGLNILSTEPIEGAPWLFSPLNAI